jgi:hypothetical protein
VSNTWTGAFGRWLESRQIDIGVPKRFLREAYSAGWCARDAEINSAAARIRELEQWKQAVIDGLMVAEIYQEKHESDPKAALNSLIDWHAAVEAHGHSKNTEAALRLNEMLTAQLTAHEKVCAGVQP